MYAIKTIDRIDVYYLDLQARLSTRSEPLKPQLVLRLSSNDRVI
jgi:hypothetical protein